MANPGYGEDWKVGDLIEAKESDVDYFEAGEVFSIFGRVYNDMVTVRLKKSGRLLNFYATRFKKLEPKVGDRVRITEDRESLSMIYADKFAGAVGVVARLSEGQTFYGIQTDEGVYVSLYPGQIYVTERNDMSSSPSTSNPELEEYKKKVYQVALKAKQENSGWCDEGFQEALEELGIDRSITEEGKLLDKLEAIGGSGIYKIRNTRVLLVKHFDKPWTILDGNNSWSNQEVDDVVRILKNQLNLQPNRDDLFLVSSF